MSGFGGQITDGIYRRAEGLMNKNDEPQIGDDTHFLDALFMFLFREEKSIDKNSHFSPLLSVIA
jgi:hypothetical protein